MVGLVEYATGLLVLLQGGVFRETPDHQIPEELDTRKNRVSELGKAMLAG